MEPGLKGFNSGINDYLDSLLEARCRVARGLGYLRVPVCNVAVIVYMDCYGCCKLRTVNRILHLETGFLYRGLSLSKSLGKGLKISDGS